MGHVTLAPGKWDKPAEGSKANDVAISAKSLKWTLHFGLHVGEAAFPVS